MNVSVEFTMCAAAAAAAADDDDGDVADGELCSSSLYHKRLISRHMFT